MVRWRPRFMLRRSALKPLLQFGVSVVALDLIAELAINADYLVVGNRLGAVALGFYTMAFRLPELLISNVFWVFSTVAFPVYAKARSAGSGAFREAMLRALRAITIFGFAGGVALALVSRDAVTVLFSSKWDAAATPMALLSLAIGLSAVGYASGDIFKAAGKPWTLLAFNAPGALLILVSFWVAATYGIVAVAWVHLIYNAVYLSLRLVVANRFVGATLRDSLVAMKPAFTVAASIVVFGLPARMLATGLTGLVVTSAAVVLGGAVGMALAGPGVRLE